MKKDVRMREGGDGEIWRIEGMKRRRKVYGEAEKKDGSLESTVLYKGIGEPCNIHGVNLGII